MGGGGGGGDASFLPNLQHKLLQVSSSLAKYSS